NGFIFGRGNQQISWRVIKKVGKNGIIVVATKDKLASIENLKVDTGNEELNEELRGYMKVITGYNESKIMKVI
ncbi:MAG: ATP-NAD kinase, partial [Thermoplasmata archaeon]